MRHLNPLFIFTLLSFSLLGWSKVDSALTREIQNKGTADVLVYFGSKRALQYPSSLSSPLVPRKARIAWVKDKLISNAESLQVPVLKLLQSKNYHYRAFYIDNVILVRSADQELLEQLSKEPSVRELRLDQAAPLRLPRVQRPPNDEKVPGHIPMLQVDKVWSEFNARGKGIVIAGQDTGYYVEHNALRNQYRGFSSSGMNHNYNWHDATETRSPKPIDDHSHGTHTMGTMVGFDGKRERIGVAPEAKWIGCRNMQKGIGKVSTYLECFEFFLAPYPFGADPRVSGRPELAPHIVNNSWACPPKEGCKGDEFVSVVRALKAAGIFVVNAAGNEGPNCRSVAEAPANYAGELLTVGAYNRYTQDIAIFSSRGPSSWNGQLAPDVVAPGEIIRSSVTGHPDKYDDKAGTSMAAPQIAGVVALLWSAYPELVGQVDRTSEILRRTAKPLTSKQTCGPFAGNQIPNAVFGYGMVDALAAFKASRN